MTGSAPRPPSAPRGLDGFKPPTRDWFLSAFAGPSPPQAEAWPKILDGRSTLIAAPTGSGKTLAAFLVAIDRLLFADGGSPRGRVLYVSPVKALAVDVQRNLTEPLAGISAAAERAGVAFRPPSVAVRSGDTPQTERARMRRQPPDILITTPESLFLILTSAAREMLRAVDTIILDEIHAVVGTKRGAHLALSVERVEALAGRRLQRIGLSATVQPLDTVAEYLAGSRRGRAVEVVNASGKRAFDVGIATAPMDADAQSVWPALHRKILSLIDAHRSTIVFVNSRRVAERLAGALNEIDAERQVPDGGRDANVPVAPLVRAHHGSLAKDEREIVESALKRGELKGVVATSSLELGIDMGAVDLVIQVETPPSVASAIQRVGRASHHLGGVPRATFFATNRHDLLCAAATVRGMKNGEVEPVTLPRNPLDVLAQQVLSIVAVAEQSVDDVYDLVRRAAPFRTLPRASFEGVLDMLSGRYPSHDFADLRPRIAWDRARQRLRARDSVARLLAANAGTIPDRGLFAVYLNTTAAGGGGTRSRTPSRRVGELDEEMVFESRVNDIVTLGATSWRIDEIQRDRVLVSPAPGLQGRMPFWKADSPPRPIEAGIRIARLARELDGENATERAPALAVECGLDADSARALGDYVRDQRGHARVPNDRALVLERMKDEMGDLRLCLLSFLGGRVHQPLTLAILRKLKNAGVHEAEAIASNDGVVFRLPDREKPPALRDLLPSSAEVEDLVRAEITQSAHFAARFREAAFRALLLPRRAPGARSPLWAQRQKAHALLSVASRYPEFPLVLESVRECLLDDFDMPATVDLLKRIERREVRLVDADVDRPSPFAGALLFGYVANYMYEGDAPLAERRAQALAIDEAQLKALLGDEALAESLDPATVDETSREATGHGFTIDREDADALHDLLLRHGDLSRAEIEGRFANADLATSSIARLFSESRVTEIRVGGEERLVAIEDGARYRDALGVRPARTLPPALAGPTTGGLRDIALRFARTRGPFPASAFAARYGLAGTAATETLAALASEGALVRGRFRPTGDEREEWCAATVFAQIRRRSLLKARGEAEPVDHAAFARFQIEWQGPAGDGLLSAIEQLQGAPLVASALDRDILRVRVPEYRDQDLDVATSSGEVVIEGRGRLGSGDGRIALYLALERPRLARFSAPRVALEGGEFDAIRELLRRDGASFFPALQAASGMRTAELLEALWDLFWNGEVLNDSASALRARIAGEGARAARVSRLARRPAYRSRIDVPRAAAGRWSLAAATRPRGVRVSPADSTEQGLALVEQLIARYGVVTREAVSSEGIEGGFAALYPLLRALEERGRIRRGYFVSGLGALQFGDPAAVDALRSHRAPGREPKGVVLSAVDPGLAWGAALPWPEAARGRIERSKRFHAVLVDGRVAASIEADGRAVHSIPANGRSDSASAESAQTAAAAEAIARWARWRALPQFGWEIGAEGPLNRGPLGRALAARGFEPSGPGLRVRG